MLTGGDVVLVTIDMVPDLALIEIFDFYMSEGVNNAPSQYCGEAWIILAHVCRKWRDIVFGSPYRLNVRLYFPGQRSVRAMLDTWPPFPIDIWGSYLRAREVDNIVAALEHTGRIHTIELSDSSIFHLEPVLAAMQNPFPSLTELAIDFSDEDSALSDPDSLLSGSAPLLRSLRLRSIRFPLPLLRNILLSTTDLVELRLRSTPDSEFISPEAMVACLFGLNKLEEFELGFRSLRIWRSQHLHPSTRCVLPALTSLQFIGSCEYLEDLLAPIDSPLLHTLDVLFHHPELDTPQLAQFVDRTPKLKALHDAHIRFRDSGVSVSLPGTSPKGLYVEILRVPSPSSVMAQLCHGTSSYIRTLIPMIKHLYIIDRRLRRLYSFVQDIADSSQWLDLLGPFIALEDLYLSRELSPHIVPALHKILEEGTVEVLPSLQNLFLERELRYGQLGEAVGQLVSALRLSSRPIAVLWWDT